MSRDLKSMMETGKETTTRADDKRMFLLDEPLLTFAHSQSLADPRDGLTLFGPLDPSKVYGIRAGVVGTVRGREIFKGWLSTIHKPILSDLERPDDAIFRPFFPGFQSAFRIPWNATPQAEVILMQIG
jgi:hypothetical protein